MTVRAYADLILKRLNERPLKAAVLFVVLIHFATIISLPVGLTWDSQLYLELGELFGYKEFWSNWDYLRTPFFPFVLWIATSVFGQHDLPLLFVTVGAGVTATVVLLQTIQQRLPGPLLLVSAIALSLYPLLIAYEHFVLTETMTLLVLSCLVSVFARSSSRAQRSSWLAVGMIVAYYHRPQLIYLAPIWAVLHAYVIIRKDRLPVVKAGVIAATVVLVPLLAAFPWIHVSSDSGRTAELMFAALVKQAVFLPNDPILDGVHNTYVEGLTAASANGRLKITGVDDEFNFPIMRFIRDKKSNGRISDSIFIDTVLANPVRYLKGALRSAAVLVGLAGMKSENAVFVRHLSNYTIDSGNVMSGPSYLDAKMRARYAEMQPGGLFGRLVPLLYPLTLPLIMLGILCSFAIGALGIVRVDPLYLAIGIVPLCYLAIHAAALACVDRYAFPVHPMFLMNLVLASYELFLAMRKRSQVRAAA